jgi:hypothetical protein
MISGRRFLEESYLRTGTAGTANRWEDNEGATASSPGICGDKDRDGDGDD